MRSRHDDEKQSRIRRFGNYKKSWRCCCDHPKQSGAWFCTRHWEALKPETRRALFGQLNNERCDAFNTAWEELNAWEGRNMRKEYDNYIKENDHGMDRPMQNRSV